MDETQIELGGWTWTDIGDLEAPCTVAAGVNPPQPTVVRVDAATAAEVGLAPEVDLSGLDARARRAVAHLTSTGRIAPELRLSALDLRGVVDGGDPPDDSIQQSGPEA